MTSTIKNINTGSVTNGNVTFKRLIEIVIFNYQLQKYSIKFYFTTARPISNPEYYI